MIVLNGKSQFVDPVGALQPEPSAVEQAFMDLSPTLWIQPSPERVLVNGAVIRETLDRALGVAYRPVYAGAPRLVAVGDTHALRFGMEGASSQPSGLASSSGVQVMPADGTFTAAYVLRMPTAGSEGTGTWPPQLWASGGVILGAQHWYHVMNKETSDINIQQADVGVGGFNAAVRTGQWLSLVVTIDAGAGGSVGWYKNGVFVENGPTMTIGGIAEGDRGVIIGGEPVNPFYGEVAFIGVVPGLDMRTDASGRAAVLDLVASIRAAAMAE